MPWLCLGLAALGHCCASARARKGLGRRGWRTWVGGVGVQGRQCLLILCAAGACGAHVRAGKGLHRQAGRQGQAHASPRTSNVHDGMQTAASCSRGIVAWSAGRQNTNADLCAYGSWQAQPCKRLTHQQLSQERLDILAELHADLEGLEGGDGRAENLCSIYEGHT